MPGLLSEMKEHVESLHSETDSEDFKLLASTLEKQLHVTSEAWKTFCERPRPAVFPYE